MSLKYLISSIVMFLIILCLNKYLLNNMAVLKRMVLDIGIGLITYIGVLIILKDEFVIKYVKKLY